MRILYIAFENPAVSTILEGMNDDALWGLPAFYYPFKMLVERGHTVDVLTIDSHYHTENINGVKVIWLDTIIGKGRKNASIFVRRCMYFLRVFPVFDLFKLKKILINGKYDIMRLKIYRL